jgi:hypothetical protein
MHTGPGPKRSLRPCTIPAARDGTRIRAQSVPALVKIPDRCPVRDIISACQPAQNVQVRADT